MTINPGTADVPPESDPGTTVDADASRTIAEQETPPDQLDDVVRTIAEQEIQREQLKFPAPLVELPHDKTRKRIAYALIALLALVDVYALVLLTLTGPDASQISDMLERIATPVIGLAGTAVGFYFGDRRS